MSHAALPWCAGSRVDAATVALESPLLAPRSLRRRELLPRHMLACLVQKQAPDARAPAEGVYSSEWIEKCMQPSR
ncbi:hypothetical protein GQ53DRAFT_753506 [Thozetella sp. PMI_491]|nr:hypothetical protein GQ53DRAFT_753506 [Thozetella sp. PMI_491]